jgi:hypothetical protein
MIKIVSTKAIGSTLYVKYINDDMPEQTMSLSARHGDQHGMLQKKFSWASFMNQRDEVIAELGKLLDRIQ